MRMKRMAICTLSAALALGPVGVSTALAEDSSEAIQIKGSDTMVNLTQAWAERFMEQHSEVSIAVTGGGSGTGISALIGGTTDIAASSRKINAKEAAAIAAKGAEPFEELAALDGLVVAVHPDNPVKQLTLRQLADIFTGTIRSWDAVGGPKKEIVILSREVNSGTHVYFKEHVLAATSGEVKEFAPEALLLSSSQAIADEVAGNPAAIGYYGLGYLHEGNAPISVAKTDAGPYVAPSESTVRDGTYPISRPLFLYTRGTPQGAVKQFLDFAWSPEGQRIVLETDFVPVGGAAPGS